MSAQVITLTFQQTQIAIHHHKNDRNGTKIIGVDDTKLLGILKKGFDPGAAAAAAARTRGNEINTARRPNALLTCRLVVF